MNKNHLNFNNLHLLLKIITTLSLILLLFCNNKGSTISIPMITNNSSISPEEKVYITDSTVTPQVFDYSNETSLPVDFGISVSAALDASNLSYVDRFKPIGILFSTMMDRNSVQNHFELKDSSNQTIEGTFYWSGSKLYF